MRLGLQAQRISGLTLVLVDGAIYQPYPLDKEGTIGAGIGL
jgi:hypothetical protein